MNTTRPTVLLILLCVVTLIISGIYASADEIKQFQDGEVIVLNNTTEKGVKNYSISVLFWHESPNDFTALQGVIEGLKILRLPCTLTIRQALKDKQKAQTILANLKSSPPDLIYTMGTEMSKLTMAEIYATPIVFTAVTNPILAGITPDWKSSGRNIAGNSNWIETETILRKFQETMPALKKLGVMYNPDNTVSSMEVAAAEQLLRQNKILSIELVTNKVKNVTSLKKACQSLLNQGVDAIWIPIDILIYKNIHELIPITNPAQIPLLSSSHREVENGAILGLVIDYITLGKKSVIIANKILTKGVAPGDIPIGTMSNYKTIINLRAADRIGYEVPLGILATADMIIE